MNQIKFREPWHIVGALLALLLWTAPVAAGKASPPKSGTSYTYLSVGYPDATSTATPVANEQSIALVGGGYDVGEVFRWMITRAGVGSGTGGHFLVIRATGTDAYNPYIYSETGQVDTTTPMGYEMVGGRTMGLSSASTLIIPNRTAANDPQVAAIIGRASAIFIAGGNQADYYNYWRGTGVETALRAALRRNIPVGGTSAGAEMLGQFAFVALNGSVTSSQALGDPFNKYMTIDPLNTAYSIANSFISVNALASTITDVHVNTRDRLGRSIGFMARLGTACGGPLNDTTTRTIALDEETALLFAGATISMAVNPFNPDNFTSGLYRAANSAYFVSTPTTAPSVCKARTPLTYQANGLGVRVTRWSDESPRLPSTKTSYIVTSPTLSYDDYGVVKGAITFNNGISAPF